MLKIGAAEYWRKGPTQGYAEGAWGPVSVQVLWIVLGAEPLRVEF